MSADFEAARAKIQEWFPSLDAAPYGSASRKGIYQSILDARGFAGARSGEIWHRRRHAAYALMMSIEASETIYEGWVTDSLAASDEAKNLIRMGHLRGAENEAFPPVA